jgi:uncharacterized protein
MAIVQQGSINTTALIVPGLYVQIVPPQALNLNGVPSNIIGVVGTAQWGPVNVPTIVGNMQQYAANFGAIQNRLNDMGTVVAIATQQGANSFKCVRVTDGTDVKATLTAVATCLTLTAIYSGTLGNSLVAAMSTGSKAGSFKFTIGLPGLTPEVYDNLTGTGNAFWVNVASAINNGNSLSRGPSQLVSATAGAGTSAATATTYGAFTGGLDGATTITSTVLIGQDGLSRTGMYALRGQGCSIGVLADMTTSSAWSTVDGFGQTEGVYMIQACASGLAISNGSTGSVDLKTTAGLDSYSTKLMHGDWIYWLDTVNGLTRLVSPQGFAAGRLGNLSPEQSSLNKQLFNVSGSQKAGIVGSAQQTVYTQADLTALAQAGIDVIINPSPGGAYWSLALGHNSSSNAAIHGDNYTRMTNYIAATLKRWYGQIHRSPHQHGVVQSGDFNVAELLRQPASARLAGAEPG